MNQYEIAIIYDPDLEIDLSQATSRIEKIFTTNGGKNVKSDIWGKRKLAYPIKKHESGIYVIYTLNLPVDSVSKIEATLNITDEVIRFLIIKPDLKAIAKAETARAEKLKKAAERDGKTDNDNSLDVDDSATDGNGEEEN